MFREFKQFIAQGNVMDLAVGMIIGASFKAIVDSLVADIISPIIGMVLGGVDFSALSVTVGEAQIMYGNFINAIISFIIIAFVMFLMIKGVNKLRTKKEVVEEAAGPSNEEVLLAEIRDLLRK